MDTKSTHLPSAAGDETGAAKDVANITESAKDYARRLGDAASGAGRRAERELEDAGGRIRDKAEDAWKRGERAADELTAAGMSAGRSVYGYMREQPLLAAALALGIGFLAAELLRRRR